MRRIWKTVRVSRPFQVALGRTLASYLRLVWNTSSLTIEPADLYDRVDAEIPFILTFWHGQHFLMPFVMKSHHKAKVMISRHADADINAVTAEAFGVGTIRGSGAHGRDFLRKGGISATKMAIDTLKAGVNVAMTAVRVPVPVGHASTVLLETEPAITPEAAREALAAFPGIRVMDDPKKNVFPTPVDGAGIDDVLVGRIRRPEGRDDALLLFACGDNLRKGAALNAVQIAERLVAAA